MICFFLNHNLALNLNLFGDGGIKIKSKIMIKRAAQMFVERGLAVVSANGQARCLSH